MVDESVSPSEVIVQLECGWELGGVGGLGHSTVSPKYILAHISQHKIFIFIFYYNNAGEAIEVSV